VKYTSLNDIKVGDYDFLGYIVKNKSLTSRINNTIEINPIKVNTIRIISEKGITYNVLIKNMGDNKINDLYFEYDKNIFEIDPYQNIDLNPDESKEVKIAIKDSYRKNISDFLTIKSDSNNISQSLNFDLRFVYNIINISNGQLNYSNLNESENVTNSYYCVELGGSTCSILNEKCNGNEISSLDGKCCIGKCESTSSGSSAWIGYVLGGILILILVYFYMSYKKVKPNKNILEKTIEDTKTSTKINKPNKIDKPIP
jgi:hypothetical protein